MGKCTSRHLFRYSGMALYIQFFLEVQTIFLLDLSLTRTTLEFSVDARKIGLLEKAKQKKTKNNER